jgi:uracil-DNA glycosylase
MRQVRLAHEEDFAGWRDAARALVLADVPPDEVDWQVGGAADDLFVAPDRLEAVVASTAFSVPRAFLTLAETVVRHSDPNRFALLYAFLHRLRGRPQAIADSGDAMLRRLEAMAKDVRTAMAHEKIGKNIPRAALVEEPAAGAQAR